MRDLENISIYSKAVKPENNSTQNYSCSFSSEFIYIKEKEICILPNYRVTYKIELD